MPFVRGCENLLNKSARMKQILDNHSIFNSKRQANNLKRLLTKFDTITEDPRVYKCGDKRCKVCPDLIEGTRIELKNGHHFEVEEKYDMYINLCNIHIDLQSMWRLLCREDIQHDKDQNDST